MTVTAHPRMSAVTVHEPSVDEMQRIAKMFPSRLPWRKRLKYALLCRRKLWTDYALMLTGVLAVSGVIVSLVIYGTRGLVR